MPWFKVDDAFHGHPKVLELSLPAVGLWTLAGSWCANYLTDGEITLRAIGRLGGSEKNAQELVDAGLWIPTVDESFQFKDWRDYQPLKSEIEAERDAARERMKVVRSKKKGTVKPDGSGEHIPNVQPNNPRTFGRSSEEVRVTPTQPDPAHPVPTDQTPPNGGVPRKRASRIAEDFEVTQEMRLWASTKAPNADLALETEKFINFWVAKSGKDATKLDWAATWRNWMLNAKPPQGQRMDHSARGIAKGTAMLAAWDARNSQEAFPEIEG
jgi:hypothetical protein